jgi:hypothetical protein
MKTEWNPLDIEPVAELTLHGDARLMGEFRGGRTVMIDGYPHKVTGITDDGDSVTYKLEATWLD